MFLLSILAIGCDSTGTDFRPVLTDAKAVYDIGELRVLPREEFQDAAFDPTTVPDAVHYGRLGAHENPGARSGATFQFRGTGEEVCVVVDPEAVFWNVAVGTNPAAGSFLYQDHYDDDGDLDLSGGLTAYYTGSPGVEIGDFKANYTDPTGVDHTLEFNECKNYGYWGDEAHAGRATTEFCTIDTDQREGILYTIVMETFRLPNDDSMLNFGTAVYGTACDSIARNQTPDECTLPNEAGNAEPDGALPADKAWFPELEDAFCRSAARVNTFCRDGFENADWAANPPCVDPDPSDNTNDEGGGDTGGGE